MMSQGQIEGMYKNLPVVTRFFGTAVFVVSVAVSLKLMSPMIIVLDWQSMFTKLQLWRAFTDYFYIGSFSFGWLIHLYLLVSFSSRLEQLPMFSSHNQKGAYLYFLAVEMIILDVISYVMYAPTGRPVLCPALLFSIIYYWSKKEPLSPVSLWGFMLTAQQFPYALLLLDLVTGQPIFNGLAGIAAGHLYFFLRDVLPAQKNIRVLPNTPNIFKVLTEKMDFFGPASRPASQHSTQYSSQNAASFSGLRGSSVFSVFRPSTGSASQFPGRGYRLND